MKKIKLNQIMASAKGVFDTGSIIELEDTEADFLITTRQAVLIEEIQVKAKEDKAVINTVIEKRTDKNK